MLITAAAAALVLPFWVGCRSTDASPPTHHVLTATLAEYDIHAVSDRPATIAERDDHVLIRFGHHLLRVEEGRVVLDEKETAAFPVAATRIVVELVDGRLRMTADGREYWKKPMPGE